MASRAHLIGVGPLTARRVIGDAYGMLRQSLGRIAAAAFVFFALPALIATLADNAIDSLTSGHGTLLLVAAVGADLLAVSLRVLGPVAFAGFLDEAVAREYLHGERRSLRDVLRNLPWWRLVVADLIVVVIVAIGLELLIVPGLVAFGGVGLIGPVIVQERQPVLPSLRRTIALARGAPVLVAALVVTPFAVEQIVHEVIHLTLHGSGLGAQVLAEWLVAVVLGGTLGLLEVALATELMARHPRVLLDDGQTPAV
ncbi:MAG TPA: hypothetical protein VH371_05295 [Candidatus Limnocylindrales bacterium]